jgi:hypothetical protein
LATTLFAVAFSISDRPFVSRFQRIAAFLTFYPSLESRFINGQVENLRRPINLPNVSITR